MMLGAGSFQAKASQFGGRSRFFAGPRDFTGKPVSAFPDRASERDRYRWKHRSSVAAPASLLARAILQESRCLLFLPTRRLGPREDLAVA